MRAPWRWLADFARKSAQAPDWSVLENYLRWAGGGSSSSGIAVNASSAMQAMAVYASIKVLAEGVGMLPCNLLEVDQTSGKRKLATSHDLFSLLHDQPNDWQTSVEFWEMVVAHLCLRGNSYAFVNRTKRGDIVELLPQSPDAVTPRMTNDYRMLYDVRLPDGKTQTLEQGEIIHFRGLSLDGWCGISPIAYARESIGLSLAAEKFGSLLFRNGAKMGGVLEHPGKLGDEAYKRLKDSFDAATSGDNAHKTALLEEGMKFAKVSMSSEDAQFLETRKYQRSEIAALYRVPPHMIGDLEKATFSNIEQQAIEFATFTLSPWLVRIEKAVKRDLLRPGEKKSMSLKFNTAALMRGDAKSRGEFYASGIVNGWMTRNEARRAESDSGLTLNPLEGLDEPLKPLNMIGANEKPPAPVDVKPPAEPGNGGKPQQPVKDDTALADSIAALAVSVARQPAPYFHADPAAVDLRGATIHHAAPPPVRLDFIFDADGNVTGAQPVTQE